MATSLHARKRADLLSLAGAPIRRNLLMTDTVTRGLHIARMALPRGIDVLRLRRHAPERLAERVNATLDVRREAQDMLRMAIVIAPLPAAALPLAIEPFATGLPTPPRLLAGHL